MRRRDPRRDGAVVPGGPGWVVLLPGFQIPAAAYRALAEAIAPHGATVYIPQLIRPGPGALLGRTDPRTEAVRAAAVVSAIRSERDPAWVVLAGHSRGGLVAWLVAAHLRLDGLVLIDPVDGAGPRPRRAVHTADTLRVPYQALIIGAGVGGPCAPEHVNHEAFADATPGCRHVVLPGLGHADVLDGAPRRIGRRLCGGGPNPVAARAEVAGLISATLPL